MIIRLSHCSRVRLHTKDVAYGTTDSGTTMKKEKLIKIRHESKLVDLRRPMKLQLGLVPVVAAHLCQSVNC
jgi:hypothetical protein